MAQGAVTQAPCCRVTYLKPKSITKWVWAVLVVAVKQQIQRPAAAAKLALVAISLSLSLLLEVMPAMVVPFLPQSPGVAAPVRSLLARQAAAVRAALLMLLLGKLM